MRVLTMDEVGVVSGGGILPTYNSSGVATLTNSGSSAPSFLYSPNDGMLFGGAVNGGFASQDAQLQCYADWLNAGCPDIQGQSAPDYLEEVKVTAQRVGQSEINGIGQAEGAVTSPGILSKIIGYVSDLFDDPHQYSAVSPLLLCTPDQAMQALMAPWMTAPGAPQAQEGINLPVSLLFGYPILQTVNTSEGKIINVAQPDHIFQGQVTTQVSAGYGGSQITTYGTGVAGENIAMGAINTMIGHLYFGGRNIAVSMECDAINGVYVP